MDLQASIKQARDAQIMRGYVERRQAKEDLIKAEKLLLQEMKAALPYKEPKTEQMVIDVETMQEFLNLCVSRKKTKFEKERECAINIWGCIFRKTKCLKKRQEAEKMELTERSRLADFQRAILASCGVKNV